MKTTQSYIKAKELLQKARSKHGFLASAEDITNYKRVWARDGVICGLAALLDGDLDLIKTFRATLNTLAENQHELGHIPSNVFYDDKGVPQISFGGLAGRVDTISWFIIGVCNYCFLTKDTNFFDIMLPKLKLGLKLLEAWEFNNNDLIYVPRSGNWADEYVTEGHVFYDQVLRLWALRCLEQYQSSEELSSKISRITNTINANYRSGNHQKPYHPRAYSNLKESTFWQASVNPSGYQKMYDAFGNSLALFLRLGDVTFQKKLIDHSEKLRKSLKLELLPAFWEPITEESSDWKTLLNNCKYEFRNHPFEFHNGGTWQMINGFYGMALIEYDSTISKEILSHICVLNEADDYSFYENFNTETGTGIGTVLCTWSAAAEIMLTQSLTGKKLMY